MVLGTKAISSYPNQVKYEFNFSLDWITNTQSKLKFDWDRQGEQYNQVPKKKAAWLTSTCSFLYYHENEAWNFWLKLSLGINYPARDIKILQYIILKTETDNWILNFL